MNNKGIDYNTYKPSKKEMPAYLSLGFLASFGILYLFFSSVFVSAFAGAIGAVLFLKFMCIKKAEKRRRDLMIQFRDAIMSMTSALSAGYSMDNSVSEAYRDLMLLYREEKDITLELKNMEKMLSLGETLDDLLMDLGARSGVEDIIVFAEVYKAARKSGGNLVRVMKRTSESIADKIDIEREVQTMISGKKMESSCMMIIPLLIIVYLRVFSPGFLDPLYQGLIGRGFMLAALIVYVVSVLWSNKIMNIKY